MTREIGFGPGWVGLLRAPQARLFRKYAAIFASIMCGALVLTAAVGMYFSYSENLAALLRLQDEQAISAASTIERYMQEIERQIIWTMPPERLSQPNAREERQQDFLRLLRQYPAVVEVQYLDGAGREELLISRRQTHRIGSEADFSGTLAFVNARTGRTYFGPVEFREGSEPYFQVALKDPHGSGVTLTEVNLKIVWYIVSQMEIGQTGHTYVVDGRGTLIADPDIGRVLRQTSLATLPQVRAALDSESLPSPRGGPSRGGLFAPGAYGGEVLTSHQVIKQTGWYVFVEQPAGEALAPLYASILRTVIMLLLALQAAGAASLFLAHKMVAPIRALTIGAQQIGAGALDQRVEIRRDDELDVLAEAFNTMASRLRESYTSLERLVAERTSHLELALAALRESEQRLRLALSAAEMGSWDWDPATDEVILSPEVQQMFGVDQERVSVEALQRVMHEQDWPKVGQAAQAAVTDGVPIRVGFRVITADGADRWIALRGGAFRDERNADATRVIGIARDVTTRNRRQSERTSLLETINRERATLLAVMGSMTDGLIVASSASRIRSCSDQAAALLGIAADDIIGKDVGDLSTLLLSPNGETRINREAWRWGVQHLSHRPRFAVSAGTQPRRDLEVELFPIDETDALAPAIGVVLRDVSKLKLLAHLQERERIAMDLHDGVIQSLYAVGLGLAARERMLPAAAVDARAALRQAQEQLSDVIHEARSYIVDLRLEHPTGHDLSDGLEELATHLRINGLTPDLELAPDAGLPLPAEATANVLYIAREAMSNILRHAKASKVTMRLVRAGDQLVLTIRDNGLGFDTMRAGRRSGDGLRNMAERTGGLGGILRVTSDQGQGTHVELQFPISRRAGGSSSDNPDSRDAIRVHEPTSSHETAHEEAAREDEPAHEMKIAPKAISGGRAR